MIKIQGKLPRNVFLACSGGIDSMTALNFLSNNHQVTPCFFNHGTEHSRQASEFLQEFCDRSELNLVQGHCNVNKPRDQSWEEFWRIQRYKFLNNIKGTVITVHHLDDCVETWLWSSLHGRGEIIPYQHKNVIRPFRLNTKSEFRDWAEKKQLTHIEDESNSDISYTRNYIRHELMPHALRVNPGLFKTVKKKVIKDFSK